MQVLSGSEGEGSSDSWYTGGDTWSRCDVCMCACVMCDVCVCVLCVCIADSLKVIQRLKTVLREAGKKVS